MFGALDLYGMPHRVYHTKLGSTAMAGSNSLSLQEPVDWQVSTLQHEKINKCIIVYFQIHTVQKSLHPLVFYLFFLYIIYSKKLKNL